LFVSVFAELQASQARRHGIIIGRRHLRYSSRRHAVVNLNRFDLVSRVKK